MGKFKRVFLYIVATLVMLTICAMTASVVGGYIVLFDQPTRGYLHSVSPSGDYALSIDYTGPFGFGPHRMLVFGRNLRAVEKRSIWKMFSTNSTEKRRLTEFDVYNDGKNLTDRNCSIRWTVEDAHELVSITCDGEEQEAKTYQIDMTESMRH